MISGHDMINHIIKSGNANYGKQGQQETVNQTDGQMDAVKLKG